MNKSGTVDSSTIRLGWIPFWNLYPFKRELLKADWNCQIKAGTPTQVNQWLLEGSVDLAPCSSICLLNYPDFEMALPLGVASSSMVQSVYLGLHAEHNDFYNRVQKIQLELRDIATEGQKQVGLDARALSKFIWEKVQAQKPNTLNDIPAIKFAKGSATSNTLIQLFYSLWFGPQICERLTALASSPMNSSLRPVELLIGDEALIRRNSFTKILDLGSLWKEITGLPFVFAVWQSKGAFLNGWRRKILQTGELADAKMRVEPSSYYPEIFPLDETGKKLNLAEYWKVIHYKLGPKEFSGLLLFLCLVRYLRKTPLDKETIVKIMRWQTLSQGAQLHI